MLEKLDLKKELSKEAYRAQLGRLQERLRVLQRAAFEAQLATTIVLEGWDASGKGTLVGRLVEKLDPRGFRVRPTYAPTVEELYRPWMWRFWQRLPPSGRDGRVRPQLVRPGAGRARRAGGRPRAGGAGASPRFASSSGSWSTTARCW